MSPLLPVLLPLFLPPVPLSIYPTTSFILPCQAQGAPRRNWSLQLREQERMIHSFDHSGTHIFTPIHSLFPIQLLLPSFLGHLMSIYYVQDPNTHVRWGWQQDTLMNQLHSCCPLFKIKKGE